MSGFLRQTFMPQGTSRTWYLTIIQSYNNLFVPHWHYTLIYGQSVQNVTFLSEIIYLNYAFYLANYLYVHTLWHNWIKDPRHNLYHWTLPHIKDTVDGYFISILISIIYRDLLIFLHFSGTWTFSEVLYHLPQYHDHIDYFFII